MSRTLTNALARPARSRLSLLRLLSKVITLRHERLALARLDDHLLADIGLTHDAARVESERPLWDVPAHWHSRDKTR